MAGWLGCRMGGSGDDGKVRGDEGGNTERHS